MLNRWVKNSIIAITAILLLLATTYYGIFYVMPAVTVSNQSETAITHANVALPNSNLDFGVIKNGSQSTIHYDLTQRDGNYKYHFNVGGNKELIGECGYVTNNEVHKRLLVIVTKNEVFCQSDM